MGDGATDGDLWSGGRDKDRVTRLQAYIFGPVSLEQQIIEVERRDGGTAAAYLDPPQRTVHVRTAGGKEHVQHRAERADSKRSRAPRFTHHVDLDGAQMAEVNRETKVAKGVADDVGDLCVKLIDPQPGYLDAAYLRDVDGAATVDGQFSIE